MDGFMNTDNPWVGGGGYYGGDYAPLQTFDYGNYSLNPSPQYTLGPDLNVSSVGAVDTGQGITYGIGGEPTGWYDPGGGGWQSYADVALANAGEPGLQQYLTGGMDYSYEPSDWWSNIGNSIKDTSLKDWMTLGGGALSLIGALQKRNEEKRLGALSQDLIKEKIAASKAERVLEPDKFALPAALDFAKSNYILDRMVAGGKMSPEQAQLMKAQYRAANEQTLTQPQYHVGNIFNVNPFAPPKVAPINGMARGGLSLVQMGGGGQADDVDARLSSGEYVMDADTVSALGDGDTMTGARRLDQMRENVRRHKRSASPKKIPPKAKSPQGYMGKGR